MTVLTDRQPQAPVTAIDRGSANQTQRLQVLVRVRPPVPRELLEAPSVEVTGPDSIKVLKSGATFESHYEHVLPQTSDQVQVYSHLSEVVPAALQGINSTIIAYGPTGTGKTYTMFGANDMPAPHGQEPLPMQGIVFRAAHDLFQRAKKLCSSAIDADAGRNEDPSASSAAAADSAPRAESSAVEVCCSYMEIYNEKIYDLLQTYRVVRSGTGESPPKRSVLQVRELKNGHVAVPGLLQVPVGSARALMKLIQRGNQNRTVRHTAMNQNSSRGHAILLVTVVRQQGGPAGRVLRAKLNFVDLAGSERWNTHPDAKPASEKQVSEMTSINVSLLALSVVLAALSEGGSRPRHIPYRDSKLTHLLMDSLGGNCQTRIVTTVSPASSAFDETVATLKFSDRARNVMNRTSVNLEVDMDRLVQMKDREIAHLRATLASMVTKQTPGSDADSTDASQGNSNEKAEVSRLQSELRTVAEELRRERLARLKLEAKLAKRANSLPSTPDLRTQTPDHAGGGLQQPAAAVAAPKLLPAATSEQRPLPQAGSGGLEVWAEPVKPQAVAGQGADGWQSSSSNARAAAGVSILELRQQLRPYLPTNPAQLTPYVSSLTRQRTGSGNGRGRDLRKRSPTSAAGTPPSGTPPPGSSAPSSGGQLPGRRTRQQAWPHGAAVGRSLQVPGSYTQMMASLRAATQARSSCTSGSAAPRRSGEASTSGLLSSARLRPASGSASVHGTGIRLPSPTRSWGRRSVVAAASPSPPPQSTDRACSGGSSFPLSSPQDRSRSWGRTGLLHPPSPTPGCAIPPQAASPPTPSSADESSPIVRLPDAVLPHHASYGAWARSG